MKPRHETHVARHFALKAIPSFLPFIEVVRYSRRLGTRLEPLFPGYLFVSLRPPESDPGRWHGVRWSPGVRAILGTGSLPVPVPGTAIEAIQARMGEGGFIRPGARFRSGDIVAVRRGPLTGLEAVFDQPLSRAGRVRILLEFLGEQRAVEVDEIDLQSA